MDKELDMISMTYHELDERGGGVLRCEKCGHETVVMPGNITRYVQGCLPEHCDGVIMRWVSDADKYLGEGLWDRYLNSGSY